MTIGASVTLTRIMESFKELIAVQPAYKVRPGQGPGDGAGSGCIVYCWLGTALRVQGPACQPPGTCPLAH